MKPVEVRRPKVINVLNWMSPFLNHSLPLISYFPFKDVKWDCEEVFYNELKIKGDRSFQLRPKSKKVLSKFG